MMPTPEVQERLRRYLLGQVNDVDREAVEEELLTNEESFQELLMLEDEMVDEYLRGELTDTDRAAFEKNFLATPERQDKLRFGRALGKYVSAHPGPITNSQAKVPVSWLATRGWRLPKSLFSTPLGIAAFAVLLIGIGFGIWRIFFHQSEVDKGLMALNAAYREQRPLESRISGLNYAPFIQTRGRLDRIDSLALSRADAILSNAVMEKPNAATHHAMGKVYLTKKQFDLAIKEFEEALKADPNNAQVYSDMGAAWLEKGNADLGTEPGTGMEELGRCLESVNKALALNPNLHEALFNRALCYQALKLSRRAQQDWEDYLKQDPNSPWASEIRRNLKTLKDQNTKKADSSEELRKRFLAAYESRDDATAWSALASSRTRTGNSIVEGLVDSYLKSAIANDGKNANLELLQLAYAAKVELNSIGDRFTTDLSNYYATTTPAQRNTLVQARAAIKAAIDLYNRGELRSAVQTFAEARELFSRCGDEVEGVFAEAWSGYCYLRIPDRDQSTQIFQRLSAAFEKKHYKSLLAQAKFAEADAAGPNEFSKVVEIADQALAVSEQIQDVANEVRCLQAGTSMQLILGDYRASMAATYRALTLAETLPRDAKLTWPFYHETSLDFYFSGMPAAAVQFETEALQLAAANDLPLHTSRSYDRLASIFERLDNFDESQRDAELARAEAGKISDEKTRTNILAHSALTLGRLSRRRGDYSRAAELLDESVRLYEHVNVDLYEYTARKEKFLALTALHDDAGAERELSRVLYWFEQNRQKILEESYRNKFFDKDQNTYDLAIDFEISRKHDSQKAFDYAEASRGRSLLDLMVGGHSRATNRSAPDLEFARSTEPLSFQKIQQHLPRQVQLLEYAVLDDKVIVWWVTNDREDSGQTIIQREDLDRKIRSYLDFLYRGSSKNAESARQATELYEILIGPIKKYLDPSRELCIVPSDTLDFFPFAALVSPDSNKYLIQDFAIETSPSADLFVRKSEGASRSIERIPEKVLVVGNPHFDRQKFSNFEYLPAAEREAQNVAGVYGATPLIGDSATKSRVLAQIRNFEVVHFATHALLDPKSALESKLLMAKNDNRQSEKSDDAGVIEARDIYQIPLAKTHLVVLSACQTGIERAFRGEGAIGLARPFMAAGVPLVVASLWQVDSEQAANLMISFHHHRSQDHVSTVEALRRAQLDALQNSQTNGSGSCEWAAFVAIGGYATF